MSQTKAFLDKGEGDRYFQRNRAKLTASGVTPELGFYVSHLPRGGRILEIGCANGRVLDYLCRNSEGEGWGLDPSPEAVADGAMRYPKLHLAQGVAQELPFEDGFFDAVLFGFCLYLVDRPVLSRVVAEADRVLGDRGRLMITDFDPSRPSRRPYVHAPGLWSYKMFYPGLFTAHPQYVEVAKFPFFMGGEGWHADPQERVAAWVLYKDMANAYPDVG